MSDVVAPAIATVESESAIKGLTPARELEFECYWAAGGRSVQERDNSERYRDRWLYGGLCRGEWRCFVLRTGQIFGTMVRGSKPEPIRRRTISALERAMRK